MTQEETIIKTLGDVLDLCEISILHKPNHDNMERMVRLNMSEKQIINHGWEIYHKYGNKNNEKD